MAYGTSTAQFQKTIVIGQKQPGVVVEENILDVWESRVREQLAAVPAETVEEVIKIVGEALGEMQWQSR